MPKYSEKNRTNISNWKYPGGYFIGDEFVHYKGVDDPKYIQDTKDFHENLGGWWCYIKVPNEFRPSRFKVEKGRY